MLTKVKEQNKQTDRQVKGNIPSRTHCVLYKKLISKAGSLLYLYEGFLVRLLQAVINKGQQWLLITIPL